MKKNTILSPLQNHCISCGFLCITKMYSGNIEEVPDADREVIVKGIYPKDYHPAEYSCYEKWKLPHNTNELMGKKCPANR